jgi:hypothetical protein
MNNSSLDCVVPTSEDVVWIDFAADPEKGGAATVGTWNQDLHPEDVNLEGRTVLEQGPDGSDNCTFQGSIVGWSGRVTGTAWYVDDPEFYGFDYIGFPSGSIDYYREQGKSGCNVTFSQDMYVACKTTLQKYATHTLSYSVDITYANSKKDSNNKQKPYVSVP